MLGYDMLSLIILEKAGIEQGYGKESADNNEASYRAPK